MANKKPLPLIPIRNISYSSLLSFHSCPRKYMLRKALPRTFDFSGDLSFGDEGDTIATAAKVSKSDITLAYGKAVGVGIQSWMMGRNEAEIMLDMFLAWDTAYDAEDEKSNKSFGQALLAVERFQSLQTLDVNLEDYELAVVPSTGRAAVELGFAIQLPNDYWYRGFIDAVLVNKFTGEFLVLECKTTGARSVSAAKYQNSEQALGYAVVLDKIFGSLSSFGVLYTVYLTLAPRWETFHFAKGPVQRASWFMNTYSDINRIEKCITDGYFPSYGESCEAWGRPCEFLGSCHQDMSAFYMDEQAQEDASKYDVIVSMQDLLDAQIKLTESGSEE